MTTFKLICRECGKKFTDELDDVDIYRDAPSCPDCNSLNIDLDEVPSTGS